MIEKFFMIGNNFYIFKGRKVLLFFYLERKEFLEEKVMNFKLWYLGLNFVFGIK